MPNDFWSKDNLMLIHVAQTLVSVAGNDPKYAIPKATTDAIANEAATLGDLALQIPPVEGGSTRHDQGEGRREGGPPLEARHDRQGLSVPSNVASVYAPTAPTLRLAA